MPKSSTNLSKKKSSEKEMKVVNNMEITENVVTDSVSSGPEDWEALYVPPPGESDMVVDKAIGEELKTEVNEPEKPEEDDGKMPNTGSLVGTLMTFLNDTTDDDSDTGFILVKSKGAKAKERREARDTTTNNKIPIKKFNENTEDPYFGKANAFGNTYVNIYTLKESKVHESFHSVDKCGTPTRSSPPIVPKKETIEFGLSYTEVLKRALESDYAEKLPANNSVVFIEPPHSQSDDEELVVLQPIKPILDRSDSEEDDFFESNQRKYDFTVDLSEDRKQMVYNRTEPDGYVEDEMASGIRLIEQNCQPSAKPPGIHITKEEVLCNMAAAEQIIAPKWIPNLNANFRRCNREYMREVDRALSGDTSLHPEHGSDLYFKTAENYALYGDNFMDFPPDFNSILAMETTHSEAPSSDTAETANESEKESKSESESVSEDLSSSGIVKEPMKTETEDEEMPQSQPVELLHETPVETFSSNDVEMEGTLSDYSDYNTTETSGNTDAPTPQPHENFNNNAEMRQSAFNNFDSSNYGASASYNAAGFGPRSGASTSYAANSTIYQMDGNGMYPAMQTQQVPATGAYMVMDNKVTTFVASGVPNQPPIMFSQQQVNTTTTTSNMFMASNFNNGPPVMFNSLGSGAGVSTQQYTNSSFHTHAQYMSANNINSNQMTYSGSGAMFQPQMQPHQIPVRNARSFSNNVLGVGPNVGGAPIGFSGACPGFNAPNVQPQQLNYNFPNPSPPGFRSFNRGPNHGNANSSRR